MYGVEQLYYSLTRCNSKTRQRLGTKQYNPKQRTATGTIAAWVEQENYCLAYRHHFPKDK